MIYANLNCTHWFCGTVTEYEIERGLLHCPGAAKNSLCFTRHIKNLTKEVNRNKRALKYIDMERGAKRIDGKYGVLYVVYVLLLNPHYRFHLVICAKLMCLKNIYIKNIYFIIYFKNFSTCCQLLRAVLLSLFLTF